MANEGRQPVKLSLVAAADLIRSRHHQAVAGRRQRPEPHNLAHKMKRELPSH